MTSDHQSSAADRRTFLKTVGAAALTIGSPLRMNASLPAEKVRFGVDMYSLGVQRWTPFQQMDWAAKWKLHMIHFSEIRFLGSPDWKVALDPANLKSIRQRADELHLDVEIGMRSICPTSAAFEAAAGTAQEQLGRMIDAARIIKSPIVRCVLGTQADRRGPIEKHIDETVKVLKSMRSKIVDAGIKVAIENHAGDMQAQLGRSFDNLEAVLESAGARLCDVVRLNYYTTDVSGLFGAWEVVAERLGGAKCRPASTLLGVTALAFPELLIEIEATAVIGA
jgi:enamine deaminase RidA (YjgF/YER057c/UK114 family)